MRQLDNQDVPSGISRTEFRNIIAIAWGASMGGLTFAVGPLSMRSPNPIINAAQTILEMLIVPGLIGGAAISGNVHAFYLGAGAVVNGLFHFGIGWLLFPLLARLKVKSAQPDSDQR